MMVRLNIAQFIPSLSDGHLSFFKFSGTLLCMFVYIYKSLCLRLELLGLYIHKLLDNEKLFYLYA